MAAQGPHPSQALCASSLGGFQKGRDVKSRDGNLCEKPLARDDERHMMNIPFQVGELHYKHREEGKRGNFEFLGSFQQKHTALSHAGAAMSNSEPEHCHSNASPPGHAKAVGPALFICYTWDQGHPSLKAAEMGIIQQVPLDAWSQPLSPALAPNNPSLLQMTLS